MISETTKQENNNDNQLKPTKSITVEFTEQSKAVVARVEVRYTNTPIEQPSREVLEEAEELFSKAYKTASNYTIGKQR